MFFMPLSILNVSMCEINFLHLTAPFLSIITDPLGKAFRLFLSKIVVSCDHTLNYILILGCKSLATLRCHQMLDFLQPSSVPACFGVIVTSAIERHIQLDSGQMIT